MKTTGISVVPLFLSVSLFLFGFLVSTSNGSRQGNAFQVLAKYKATEDVNTTHDLTQFLPGFNPELISQEGSKESDKILKLAGQPKAVSFNQYGGYITVNKTAGRALYYYFAEAKTMNKEKPLIIWFNGGPGCSSIGYGAFEEIGPFLVKNENLIQNPYSWNKLANILFIDSPAGVGFSYSNTTSDYTSTGDSRTAQDAYTFLINWLERFPEYKNSSVYLAGESYAGHYVPQLAYTILQQNNNNHTIINLQGISIGNPVIHDLDDRGIGSPFGTIGMYEFLWKNLLISDEAWNIIQKTCDFSVPPQNRTDECNTYLLVSYLRVDANTDFYNIYAPKCYQDKNITVTSGPIGAEDPCIHDRIRDYLNRPEVVIALNAKITRFEGFQSAEDRGATVDSWDDWGGCREVFSRTWQDSTSSILPILKHLKLYGIPILIYSGDLDSVVAYTATRNSIRRLGIPVRKKWYLWGTKEADGSVVMYDGITLATVRGAGHEVPMNQPRRMFKLIQTFLGRQILPRPKINEDISYLRIRNTDDVD